MKHFPRHENGRKYETLFTWLQSVINKLANVMIYLLCYYVFHLSVISFLSPLSLLLQRRSDHSDSRPEELRGGAKQTLKVIHSELLSLLLTLITLYSSLLSWKLI